MTKIEKSDSIIHPLIFGAINNISKDLGAIGKTQRNEMQNFYFRGIDDFYNALHPLMALHGVFSTSVINEMIREDRKTSKGTPMVYTTLKITYRFHANDGSFVDTNVVGESADAGDKSCTKAMAIAHKYALTQMFTIPTAEENKDPDAQSHELLPREEPPMPETQEGPPEPQSDPSYFATEQQVKCIAAVSIKLWGKKQAWPEAQKLMVEKFKKSKLDDLSRFEASDLIKHLKAAETAAALVEGK